MDLSTATLRMIADLKQQVETLTRERDIARAERDAVMAMQPDYTAITAPILEAIRQIGDRPAPDVVVPEPKVDFSPVLAAIAKAQKPQKWDFEVHRDGADVVRKITATAK